MPRRGSNGPSQRQLRVGELVRHALTGVLTNGRISDPDLEGTLISISEVRMSPDLKIATAYITPTGGGDAERIVKALARNARFIRGRAGPELRQMKFMPEFRFRADTSFDNFARIDALLKSKPVARDLNPGSNEN